MKKYFSYSEMRLWLKDKDEYIRQYVEGEERESTPEMILGTIIHNVLENPYHPWIRELEANNMAERIPTITKLLGKMAFKRLPDPEFSITAKTKSGVLLFSKFDGFDKKQKLLAEYKTSDRPELWNKRIVDHHKQLSFYAYVYHRTYHSFFREIHLHYLNTAKGTLRTFTTARGIRDLRHIEDIIESVISEMKREGVWERRLSREDKVRRRTNPLFQVTINA